MDWWNGRLRLLLLIILHAMATTTRAANLIDVLRVLDLSEDMEGVSMEAGICTSRKDAEETDMAYRIDKKIQLSAPTKQLFPDSPFPEDFSLMTTVRAKKGAQFFLLSVYDAQGVQQLGLEVGRSPVLLYEDHQGHPSPDLYPTFKKINLADGKWHRIAYSVVGKSVTLYLDCENVQTLDLLRGDDPVVSTEGVTVFGTRLLDEEVFEGEIQQLLLVDDPSAAESYCHQYIPDCDYALPYSSLTLESEEVQVDRRPKQPEVEEFGEDFYSDLYDDLSVSTVTVAPNVTEYEIIEYEDYINGTEYHEQEYEEYEEYEDRFGLVEREDADTWDGQNKNVQPEKGEKGEPAIFEPGHVDRRPPWPPRTGGASRCIWSPRTSRATRGPRRTGSSGTTGSFRG
ncbi:hypothetical protein ANANG_G00295030 [Anguilla anguilla]|uniref:Thrombospondin-like N-terminal domain-containing protein n=1 Tax=Anguilla anguilla TaxID=7936 RepID=A0A9D3LLN8_ANGAN|nr:hypothetical protein ANANG_G00295030 [Anguilla anguilla]